MRTKSLVRMLLWLLTALVVPAVAQDVGRVSPASLPLPLASSKPLPPDVVRARNPWTLPMTGTWRFQLTHGRMVEGRFQSQQAGMNGISASSYQEEHPPLHAFDGNPSTRWCASDDTYPQWLQADLRQVRHVTGITLSWERPNERYRCRVEGSGDGKRWSTLADASATPGIFDGPLTIRPADARYVRVTVLGSSNGGWASLWEVKITVLQNGKENAWQPPAEKPTAVADPHLNDFASPATNDSGWDNLAVPSNWEVAGYSLPTYNSVDNTVGLYRRWVTVPATWSGRRIYWHFDGALDGAEVFINGQRAGYHESGYTAWDIDLTGLLHPGQRNLFAVRVCKSTPSDDCETGDYQSLGGIYRETFLVAVPQTHISDLTVRTPLSAVYRDATLVSQVQVQGRPGQSVEVAGRLYGADGQPTTVRFGGQGRIGTAGTGLVSLSAPVKAPDLWSAEKPHLYYAVYQLTSGGKPLERVEQRFGFRQVEIKNNVVLWNGRPIKCTGSCRHDFWADKGFALTDREWKRDVALMKSANINAVRTSHYNHAARFLEICEEQGLYILDEVPFCWIGDQVKDPKYAPYLIQRARETLARDKNRPCVLAWSLGNENPTGPDSQEVIDLVKGLDPTRPAFVSSTSPDTIKGQAWEDDHYPDPGYVDRVARNDQWGANFSEHPHIFYQKETQDYDPGASDLWSETLIKTWEKLWQDPIILGSFIWEWQNQGIADHYPDQKRDRWYGPDHLRQENNKGIVSAHRVPKPEWWIVKMAYSPVVIGVRTISPANGRYTVPLTNHYTFTNLGELACHWTAIQDTNPLSHGTVHIPCAPMQTTQASFPAPIGMTRLRLEFVHPDGRSVASANLAVEGIALPSAPPAMAAGGALIAREAPDTLQVSNNLQEIVFDRHSGSIRSWRVRGRELLTGGPVLNLGEAKAGDERSFYHATQPPVLDAAQVTPTPAADGVVQVEVTGTVLIKPGGSTLGTLDCTYTIRPNAEIIVAWKLDWTAPDTNLWEEGLKLLTPPTLRTMNWQRDSYFTDYPAGHLGEPSGACYAGDVSFRASKRSLHWLTLTDRAGDGLALLPTDQPLVARADPRAVGTTLFASREVAGPRDFSGSWVSEHDIRAGKEKPLSGAFTLRAIGP